MSTTPDGFAAPEVRHPRWIVRANGSEVAGCVSLESESNVFAQADTFTAVFAVSQLPASNPIAWWFATKDIRIEMLVGFPANPDSFTAGELQQEFYGLLDDAEWDVTGEVLTLTGRDLTGKLIDTKSDQKYQNQTASDVAKTLAAKYGLTPVVTSTSTKIGKYYQIDNVRMQDEKTEWELLSWLAREEGFQCFVKGTELHFQPPPAPGSITPYVVRYVPATSTSQATANATDIKVSHSNTVAKDIKVTVRSWHGKQKKRFMGVAQSTTHKGTKATSVQEYVYTIPGLTADQCQARAQQIRAELSQQEYRLTIEGPADGSLHAGDLVELRGTGTLADQVYHPVSVTRTISDEAGYTWSISAKNHDPEKEVNL